jgi:flagellar assembly protein FliH
VTANAFHVRLMRPLQGVAVRDTASSGPAPESNDPVGSAAPIGDASQTEAVVSAEGLADIQRQQAQLQQTQVMLDDLVQKLLQLQEDMLSTHRREIARLAVEIARKVLLHEVRNGDYEIEKIIQEALKNAPVQQEVVVHLHPEDLRACQSILRENPDRPMGRLALVGDATLGRAECLLETPKGVVKSFIENHLDKIREALEGAHCVVEP